jgi:FtsH-binding integral membrane protein
MTHDPKKTKLGWTPTAGYPGYSPAAAPAPAPAPAPVAQQGYAYTGYAAGAGAPPAQPRGYVPPQPGYGQPAYGQPAPQPAPAYSEWARPPARMARPSPQPNYAQAQQAPARPSPQPSYAPPQYRNAAGTDPAFMQAYQQQYAQAQQQQYAQAQAYAQYPAPQAQYSQQGYPQQQANPQYPQQPQPQPQSQPQSQPASQPDFNQRALAAMQSLRRRRAESSQRPIPHANATMGAAHRVRFIRLTYLHLLGAVLVFAGLLYLLMKNETLYMNVSIPFINFALGGRWNWGVVLAAFMAVSWVADYWASHARSRGMQYVGLGIYVVAEALIFVPLLAIVAVKTAAILAKGGGNPNILRDSAFVTLAIFGALTTSVFFSKKDFSFLRSGLVVGSSAALMLIVLSLAFGFNLGLVFSIAMVVLAAGYILYQTSQILAHYNPEQYVAASLALFSSVALMFWYIIRIFLRARD